MKPILFSTPMVQAILRNKKTQTRRIMPEQPNEYLLPCGTSKRYWANDPEYLKAKYYRSKYEIGDILWVRETWQHTKCLSINWEDETYGYVYKADKQPWEDYEGWKWKPSIHMPKEAARLFLKITDIRVERLQDISQADAIAEGVESVRQLGRSYYKLYYGNKKFDYDESPIVSYMSLWQKINGKDSWSENPYVWVYEFERIHT